jgi:hypothetical protein
MITSRPEADDVKHQKPVPSRTSSRGAKCPVCGETSYSLGGIHPQCSMAQADAERKIEITANRKTKAKTAKSTVQKSFSKVCPKCKSRVHVRKKQCFCGQRFVI